MNGSCGFVYARSTLHLSLPGTAPRRVGQGVVLRHEKQCRLKISKKIALAAGFVKA
jgi:hypothetical protein